MLNKKNYIENYLNKFNRLLINDKKYDFLKIIKILKEIKKKIKK